MAGVLKARTSTDPDVWTPVGMAGITEAEADALFLTQAEGDTRYVNTAGDTMTGQLIAPSIQDTGNLFVGPTGGGNPGIDNEGTWLGPLGDVQHRLNSINTVNAMLIKGGAADVTGSAYMSFRRYTTGIGSIGMGANAASVVYNTTSHGPWKGEVADLDTTEALDRISAWRPVSYRWKINDEGVPSADGVPSGTVEHGFIAQELNEVTPMAVTAAEGDAPWSVDLGKMVPDLVAAVQGLQAKVDELKAEVAELRAR
jgi:Chaperone of endosialidase